MLSKIHNCDQGVFIPIGLSLEECKKLMDSKPVEGTLPNGKKLRLWCLTMAISERRDHIAMASGADYAILMKQRQVKHISESPRCIDFQQPTPHDGLLRFIFFCTAQGKMEDALSIAVLMANEHGMVLGS